MKENWKFRYVNEIAGTFVLAAVALVVIGIFLAGKAQGWFEQKLVLTTALPAKQGTFGLQKGAEVRIMDTLAGRVVGIAPTDSESIEVQFEITGPFRKVVRHDSIVKVKKKFGVAGDAFVEISGGDPKSPVAASGGALRFEKEPDIMEMVTSTVQDLRTSLMPLLDNTKEILAHVNSIVKNIDEGKGAAGRLIGDPEMGDSVKQMVKDVQRTTEQLPGIASNATAISRNVQDVTRDLDKEVARLDGLMGQTQDTLTEVERLVKGIQRHWLLRNYVEQPSGAGMIAPFELLPMPQGGK